MANKIITDFYATKNTGKIVEAETQDTFTLEWKLANNTALTKLSLIGASGSMFDYSLETVKPADYPSKITVAGIQETTTFLLIAATKTDREAVPYTVLISNGDRTFDNVTVTGTVTYQ
ncbi:hypothetical protein [Streptomyces sp. FIT100]|uniref:hypothetical protein n=1 Tax=Streptomyces sp. FIT100 TaxID=2837956 RepID=UPI0021C8FBCF|nr:hypothetical protein [Streptomyces sp. FIT100]UUN30925.1 hypothetical protein KK483_34785 [Streptomyces sp. FIT100]